MSKAVTPTDDDYDDMHHALGRPRSANAETYRNHYVIEDGSPIAKRFDALGWWDFVRRINDGRDAVYCVNGAGKNALGHWLNRRAPETRDGGEQ